MIIFKFQKLSSKSKSDLSRALGYLLQFSGDTIVSGEPLVQSCQLCLKNLAEVYISVQGSPQDIDFRGGSIFYDGGEWDGSRPDHAPAAQLAQRGGNSVAPKKPKL